MRAGDTPGGATQATGGAPDTSAPPVRPPVIDLWREAGGGTSGFDPARFDASLRREHWKAVERCADDCGGRMPHLCWWAALGAVVTASRVKRRSVKAPAGHEVLFGDAA
jgi:hypothetical protein